MSHSVEPPADPYFLNPCREDQSEYIPYHYRTLSSDQLAYFPRKSLTRLIDANHIFLTEKLHEIFTTAF